MFESTHRLLVERFRDSVSHRWTGSVLLPNMSSCTWPPGINGTPSTNPPRPERQAVCRVRPRGSQPERPAFCLPSGAHCDTFNTRSRLIDPHPPMLAVQGQAGTSQIHRLNGRRGRAQAPNYPAGAGMRRARLGYFLCRRVARDVPPADLRMGLGPRLTLRDSRPGHGGTQAGRQAVDSG